MKDIVVLGGGAAGWLSALFFKKIYPQSLVTVVASEEIGIIGVGESATPYIIELLDYLEIRVLEILKSSDITFKTGVKFDGWGDKIFHHSFNLNDKYYNNDFSLIQHLLKSNDRNVFKTLNPMVTIAENNKIQKTVNNLPHYDYSIHFDANKFSIDLKRIALQRNINYIPGEVIDALIKEDNVCSLSLKDGNIVSGDFFIDCSGFQRILSKKLDIKFIKFKELLTNTAIPCPLKKVIFEPYTTAKALKFGWAWKIPTRSRTGNGYVFSSDYVDIEEAKNEFYSYLKNFSNEDIELNKVIKFEPGMLEKIHFKNVLAVGLASHFLEPLEGTSLAITSLILFEFAKNKTNFNDNILKRIQQIKNFIVVHFLTKKTNTNFWVDANKKARENEFVQNLLAGNIDFDLFKENDHYFKLINHINFLQNLGALDKMQIFSNKLNDSFSYVKLLQMKSWHYNHVNNAIDYKKYYEQL